MTCQCMFTVANFPLWGVCADRGIWELAVPSARFCGQSKTALKNKVYLKTLKINRKLKDKKIRTVPF